MTSQEFAPYFRNGMLFLPQATVRLLLDVGLDPQIGQAALKGLALDDHKDIITQISRALEEVLGRMEEDTQAFQVLSSGETQFLLTGKPSIHV
jgi:ribosomal protein RSM22 (predicted rRNA methylase)